ncbi:MAG: hypothetical protein ACFUZC_11425 [Chthoniobacteraceae bacterium]
MITTSSIRSKFNSRVVEQFLDGQPGTLATVTEERLSINGYNVALKTQNGSITPRLTLGADLNKARELWANEGVCTRSVMLSGAGFIISELNRHPKRASPNNRRRTSAKDML